MIDFVEHTFTPIYNKNSRILILGTMPSPKSREVGFYYSHPQNKFWRIISEILKEEIPQTNEQKTELLLKHNIAVWDVLKSCIIIGADDGSIKNPEVNNINIIINAADIKAIFTTGKKATELYKKYCFNKTGMESIYLPSTSPANCRFYSYEDLMKEYSLIFKYNSK